MIRTKTEKKLFFMVALAWLIGLTGLASLALVTSATARADQTEAAPDWYDGTTMEAYRQDLARLPVPESKPESCTDAYSSLFRNDRFEIRVFFGYTNDEGSPGVKADDAVYDHFIRQTFVQMLTEPCTGTLAACGFTQDPDYDDILTKEITGPDGNPRLVRIALEASSVSDSNRENRHALKKEQKSQSRKLQADFAESMRDADMVLYIGHARYGTGPGFKPLPKMSWAWIEAGLFKPAWHKTLKALRKSDTQPAIVGVFACLSEKYYRKGFNKVAPDTALILSDGDLEYDDAQASVLGSINSVLRMDCADNFSQSLVHTRLIGLFK